MLSIIPKLRCICSSKQCIIICMSSWWISKENVWKLPISDIGCQQYDGRHTSHCHRTENNAEAFFLANKLSFDLVKIAIQRYFISNLPICNGKKLTRTKLIFSPAPEWRMFHFYLFLHLSLNLCADIYESGLHWYLPWKVDREGLGTSMKKPKHTNWVAHRLHKWTCCKRGKGWNTCFLICPF